MSESYSDSAPGVNAQSQVSSKQNPEPEQVSVHQNPTPAYYAVIPSEVRYHPDLPPAAKLMYGEITSLCNLRGFCWAKNDYFMSLYGVSRATVKNWISALAKAGFITVELSQDRNHRRIHLARYFLTKTLTPPIAQEEEKLPEKIKKTAEKSAQNAAKKLATPGQKISHGGSKNWPRNIKENFEEIDNNVPASPVNVSTSRRPLQGQPEQPVRFKEPGPISAGKLRDAEPASPDIQKPASPEKKVSASPNNSDFADRVEAVVKLTGDAASRARFRQLWNICKKNRREAAWQTAYNALKTALEGRRAISKPGAYFQAILTRELTGHGVPVPVGSRAEQEEIRRLIAESLASVDPKYR